MWLPEEKSRSHWIWRNQHSCKGLKRKSVQIWRWLQICRLRESSRLNPVGVHATKSKCFLGLFRTLLGGWKNPLDWVWSPFCHTISNKPDSKEGRSKKLEYYSVVWMPWVNSSTFESGDFPGGAVLVDGAQDRPSLSLWPLLGDVERRPDQGSKIPNMFRILDLYL